MQIAGHQYWSCPLRKPVAQNKRKVESKMGSGSSKEGSKEPHKKGIAAGLKKTGGALKEVKEGKATVSILNGSKTTEQPSPNTIVELLPSPPPELPTSPPPELPIPTPVLA